MMIQRNQLLLEANWRERFYPEDHEDPGNSRVHKIISLKIKEAKHQRQSTIPGGYLLPLTYEQRVMIVCRRLAKTGDPILGRPDRLVFEEFKEKFWYTSVYHKERKGSAQLGYKHMKAWFFFHVYETLEALKERAKTSTWRPNNETTIDMCLSSDDDDQIEGDTPLFKIVEKFTPPSVTIKEAWGLRDSKDTPTQSTGPVSTSKFRPTREEERRDSTSLSHLISSLSTPIGSSLFKSIGDTTGSRSLDETRDSARKNESRESPRKSSETREKWKERSVKHSKIKFEVSTAGEADFDRFILAIEEFHRDENTQWDRNSLSPSTKATMTSQWSRWKNRVEGEEWMTMPTDRFVLFVKSIKHSYFKEATDSKYIDVSTRIIKVLQQTR
jgi:hypothetical protein